MILRCPEQELIITIAIAGACIREVEKDFINYTDENGYIPLYELIAEINDKLLLTEGSVYQRYLATEDKNDWFSINYDSCTDWYFMEKAVELIRVELKGWETKVKEFV